MKLNNLFKVLIVTVFTFFLTQGLVFIPLNFNIFSSTNFQKVDQFDIYSDLIQKSGIKPFDNNVIVVTVPQNGGRLILSDALNMLSEARPAAIAVDIYLRGAVDPDIDDMLIDAVKANKNVVLPTIYNGKTIVNDSSLLDIKHCNVNKGYIYLEEAPSSYRHSFKNTVRYNEKEYYPLALEAIRMTYPDKIEKLIERGNKKELINYKMDIPCISYEDIYSMSDMIRGKIVILGANTGSGSAYTMSQRMPSYMTNAYIASTVMNECYIDKPSVFTSMVFYLIVIMLFIHCNLFFANKFSNVGAFFIRLLTYSLFFAMVIGSYILFANYSYYIDCGQLLLAILFAPWAQDIYKLLTLMFLRCKSLLEKYKVKRNKTTQS